MIHCEYDTAVVILSYNGIELHKLFLPDIIKESKGKYDVILVDNASTDDTFKYISAHFPEVKTIQIKINNGFAKGYAEALLQIIASYYVLLSADFEVSPNWFEPIHTLMINNTNVAACQPKILYQKDKKMFEYAGAGGGFMDKWGYMFCRGRIFFTIEEDKQQYNDTIEVFWASGGCMFVRAEAYHEVGGLDDELYAHMEEIDLCWRMKNAGYKIMYCGDSKVYHVGGSVISYGSSAKIYYNYRNSLVLLTKNLPFTTLLWLLPFRLLLDGVSTVRCLLQKDFKQIKAIVKAHWHFFLSFGKWYKKRNKTKKFTSLKNMSGVYKQSIIWNYFAQKKTTYTSLIK
jgi:GT2 family glycosyltransferase